MEVFTFAYITGFAVGRVINERTLGQFLWTDTLVKLIDRHALQFKYTDMLAKIVDRNARN